MLCDCFYIYLFITEDLKFQIIILYHTIIYCIILIYYALSSYFKHKLYLFIQDLKLEMRNLYYTIIYYIILICYTFNSYFKHKPYKWFALFLILCFFGINFYNIWQYNYLSNSYLIFILLVLFSFLPLYTVYILYLMDKKNLEESNKLNEHIGSILKSEVWIFWLKSFGSKHRSKLLKQERAKEITLEYLNNRPFFDLYCFITFLTVSLLIIALFVFGLSIFNHYNIIGSPVMYYIAIKNAIIVGFIFIIITFASNKLSLIWPSLYPTDITKFVNSKYTMIDYLNKFLSSKYIIHRCIISITLYVSMFLLYTFLGEYSCYFYFAHMLPCILIPSLIIIIKCYHEKQKMFTRSNLHLFLYFAFIMFIVRLIAIPITTYSTGLFLVLTGKWDNNTSGLYKPVITPEIETILITNSKRIENLASFISNLNVNRSSPDFFRQHISSFFTLFNKWVVNPNMVNTPEWAKVKLSKSWCFIKESPLDSLPSLMCKNIYLDLLSQMELKKMPYKFPILYEPIAIQNDNVIEHGSIIKKANQSMHTLASEVKHIISRCNYSVELNHKLAVILTEVQKPVPVEDIILSRRLKYVINFLGREFETEVLSYRGALDNIRDQYPALYAKFLTNFEIKPLIVRLRDYDLLSQVITNNKCDPGLLRYVRDNCIQPGDSLSRKLDLYKLSLFREGVFSQHAEDRLYNLPPLNIININTDSFTYIVSYIGISYDQFLISEFSCYDDNLDGCMVRYGITTNTLFNFLRNVKILYLMEDRWKIWETKAEALLEKAYSEKTWWEKAKMWWRNEDITIKKEDMWQKTVSPIKIGNPYPYRDVLIHSNQSDIILEGDDNFPASDFHRLYLRCGGPPGIYIPVRDYVEIDDQSAEDPTEEDFPIDPEFLRSLFD